MGKKMTEKGKASFSSLNISGKKIVQLKFKLSYEDIVTSVNLLQGLNTDVTVIAKTGDSKAKNLGIFTIGSVNFDRDGNSTVLFKSLIDNVNTDNVCSIIDEDLIQLTFKAVLELPDLEPEDEDEGGADDWDE